METLDDALLASVRAQGAALAAGLAALPGVVEVRGRGLMLGAELDRPAGPVVAAALEAGPARRLRGGDCPAPDAAADDHRRRGRRHGLSLLEEVLT